MYESQLENIGLNQKEATIYLSLLEIGESPASKIAEHSKINRVTCYDVLDKLIEKSFVSEIDYNNIHYYSAVKPDIVSQLGEQKLQEFQTIIPALHKLNIQQAQPNVRFFHGLKGIKSIYLESLKSKTEILNYSNSEIIRRYWPRYEQEYVKKRAENKIYLRGIVLDNEGGRTTKQEDEKFHREVRLVSEKDFHFTNEIKIYDDKVVIISFEKDLMGVVIENKAIADTQRDIFKMAWKFAKTK